MFIALFTLCIPVALLASMMLADSVEAKLLKVKKKS